MSASSRSLRFAEVKLVSSTPPMAAAALALSACPRPCVGYSWPNSLILGASILPVLGLLPCPDESHVATRQMHSVFHLAVPLPSGPHPNTSQMGKGGN